ncbi:hypothetical protein [Chitinophaga qingshengii]|uniref:Uncharacterized protein n=1 Tax=Chitinophaga qingshengii TaxID=1569794 RepID=A0ABR7TS54_9BACT|nr:hypothetical protein [Chitinophaga qingshengii]MBC9933322.1 hypothetical protein [Chitinophaga qingshengii]
MRVIDFLFGIIDRFAPMDQETKSSLKLDATAAYNKAKEGSFRKKVHNDNVQSDSSIETDDKAALMEKVSVIDRVVIASESWWFRTSLAILFIVVVPKIKDYWNRSAGSDRPDDLGDLDDYEDDDDY